MTEHDTSAERSGAPTVRRVERRDETLVTHHEADLARLIEERFARQAEASARIAELAKQRNAPIQRLVEKDSAAKAALIEFRDSRIAELEARVSSRAVSYTFGGPHGPSLLPSLHPGINVFGTPFDFEIREPVSGEVEVSANRFTGTHSVLLHWGKGGGRWATAGVSLVLEAGVTGVARLRPAWHYQYQGIARGHHLGSHSEGAARLVARDAISGAILTDRSRPLWNFDDDNWEDGDGYIPSWALGADFLVQAGQIFNVTFLASAFVHDSGTDYWFGWSLARAWLEMRVLFLVVELG